MKLPVEFTRSLISYACRGVRNRQLWVTDQEPEVRDLFACAILGAQTAALRSRDWLFSNKRASKFEIIIYRIAVGWPVEFPEMPAP